MDIFEKMEQLHYLNLHVFLLQNDKDFLCGYHVFGLEIYFLLQKTFSILLENQDYSLLVLPQIHEKLEPLFYNLYGFDIFLFEQVVLLN